MPTAVCRSGRNYNTSQVDAVAHEIMLRVQHIVRPCAFKVSYLLGTDGAMLCIIAYVAVPGRGRVASGN